MSESWQAGDMAMCIHDNWLLGGIIPAAGPRKGQYLTVCKVGNYSGQTVLWFNEWPGDQMNMAFVAEGFIKITPPKEMIEEERRKVLPA